MLPRASAGPALIVEIPDLEELLHLSWKMMSLSLLLLSHVLVLWSLVFR